MIADHYLRLRTELENALASLLQLAPELERDPVMLETIQGLIRDAREPFLFVVVGEVKAGKSSPLNALFGQEFCPVDLLPATDRVYIFKYAMDEQSVDVSPQLTHSEIGVVFQPLEAFCASERRLYDPLLKRAEELEKTFAQLMRQIAKG